MNLNLIVGIIATIIVGYIGIRYAYKYKTRTSLLFFEHSCISLFKSVVKELDELEIKYKGKTVTENLIIYKGTFFNSGNNDIDKNLIHDPVKLILPDDYEWKKVKIIDQSKDVKLEFEAKTNELQFSWDILKENEFFTFDSVIEYKPKKSSKEESQTIISNITRDLSKKITFSQRITNLKFIDIGNSILQSRDKYRNIIQILIILLLFSFIMSIEYSHYVTHTTETVMTDSVLSFNNLEPGEVVIADSLAAERFAESLEKYSVSEKDRNKILTIFWYYFPFTIFGLALISFIILLIVGTFYMRGKRLINRIKQIDDKYK